MCNILSFSQKSRLVSQTTIWSSIFSSKWVFTLFKFFSWSLSYPWQNLLRFRLITWSQTGKLSDSIFPNAGFLFLNIKLCKYGFDISQLHNFLFFTFFSSFKKRHHNFPIGVSTLVEGTNQKENLSSQVRILLFENVGCDFFQQDGIQDSNSVTQCIAGLTRICLQKGRIYIQPLGRREGKVIESFSCICCFLIAFSSVVSRASQVALWLKKKKICLQMQETRVWFLDREDALKAELATHSSILAWKIPWTQEPGAWGRKESDMTEHNYVIRYVCEPQW